VRREAVIYYSWQEVEMNRIAANLIKGREAVGGHLLFEETFMAFESHMINIQAGSLTIFYRDIQSVAPRKTLGIVPNGISVITKSGQEYKFVVNKRDDIMCLIKSKARIY
jgi:hypothetical protein